MKQRIITAIIALIILVPIIIYGETPFILMTYVFATVGLYELMRMYDKKKGIAYTIIATVFLWFIVYPSSDKYIGAFSFSHYDAVTLLVIILLIMTVLTKNRFTINAASFILFATVYIGTAFYFLMQLRIDGLNYFLFVLFIIWATDSGAYFVGKSIGKRKLWPEISPNKTIGGAVGGIVIALIIGIGFQMIYPLDKTYLSIIVFTLIISVFGQIGDLIASAMKRHYEIKDFGTMFPGHGGVLDRLDSLLFVLIVLHLLQFS